MYTRKDTGPNYIGFSKKIKQQLGDLLGPKNPTRGKFISNPVFIYSRKMELGQVEKKQQVYLYEKEEEAISTIRNSVFLRC